MHQYRLITALNKSGFLTSEQSQQLITTIKQRSITVQQQIDDCADIDTHQLVRHCAALFHLPEAKIDAQSSLQLIEELSLSSLCREWFAVPVALNDQWLTLAVSDPTNTEVVDEFQFACGLNIDLAMGNLTHIIELLDHNKQNRLHEPKISSYDVDSRFISDSSEDTLAQHIFEHDQKDDEENLEDHHQHSSTPIGQFVHRIILNALNQRASDIHFEPYEHQYRIRMRIDGLLVTSDTPSRKLSRRLAARIKILARLNIAERRLPQDGRLKLKLDKQHSLDIRVSTLPTLWGEKIVLRLLGTSGNALPTTQLGLSDHQLEQLHSAIRQPQGMILLTGPTGSGKTTTLYSALQHLNQEQRNISTVEDPVEIQLSGVNQIQTHEQIGLSFASVLRALLRQDPDVIMIGEIRDQETAQMAVRAAQTGHLLLSTLHTNSAPEALIRLHQIGIPTYLLLSSLKLVVAQRLVRKLCPHCKQPDYTREKSHASGQTLHFSANTLGCTHCTAGFNGRVAVYDFFIPEKHQSEQHGIEQARARGCRLWEHGLDLVDQGITSFNEINRVIEIPEQLRKTR